MPTLSFVSEGCHLTGTLRLRQLADRFFASCKRTPIGTAANRIKEWRKGRRDLSFDMIEDGLLRGGTREYARAIYLQKAAELVEDDSDIPPMPDVQRMVTEADLDSDRAFRLAVLDGQITPDESREIEVTFINELSVLGKFLERIRRSVRVTPTPQRVGGRTWV